MGINTSYNNSKINPKVIDTPQITGVIQDLNTNTISNLNQKNDNLKAFYERIKQKEIAQAKLKQVSNKNKYPFPFEGNGFM